MKKMYLVVALVALLMISSVFAATLDRKVVINPNVKVDDFTTLYGEDVSAVASSSGDGILTYYMKDDGTLKVSQGQFIAVAKMADKSSHRTELRWYADQKQGPQNVNYYETDSAIIITASNGPECTENGFLQKNCNVIIHHKYITKFKQVIDQDYYGPVTIVYHKDTGVTDLITDGMTLNGMMGGFRLTKF